MTRALPPCADRRAPGIAPTASALRASALLACLAVAACDGGAPPPPAREAARFDAAQPMAAAPEMASAKAGGPAARRTLAYTHDITLELAPERIAEAHAAARDLCNRTEGCVVLHSSISGGGGEITPLPLQRDRGGVTARLTVKLPGQQVDPYLARLSEAGGGRQIQRSTDAEDLGEVLTDTERRLKMLEDQRGRLEALMARSGVTVADLAALSSQLSAVQSEIEQFTGSLKGLNDRLDRDRLSLVWQPAVSSENLTGPIGRALSQSADTLASSTASAILFAVAALPWVVLLAPVAWLARLLWRRRKARLG